MNSHNDNDGLPSVISVNQPSTSSVFSSLMSGESRISIKMCAFCGEKSKNLQICLFCGSVAYCSSEHQRFDWKKHKLLCKTLQSKGLVFNHQDIKCTVPTNYSTAPTVINSKVSMESDEQLNKVNFSGPTSAFKPYRSVKIESSNSIDSVSSISALSVNDKFAQSKFPKTCSEFEKKTVNVKVLSNESFEKKIEEIIIPTDDPDIQIIETEKSARAPAVRIRKRPTPSNSAELKNASITYKDHNKNLVYSTTLQEHQRHLQNRGLALNIHQAMVLRLRYIAEHVIRSLNEFGWAVVDNFLGSDHYKYTAKEIERLYERGLFSPGQLMEAKNKDEFHIKDIRSDHIYWFDGTDKRANDAATVRLLISMIDSVIQHFKKRIDHDIGGRSRAMLAIYPSNGTRYVKHVDNPVKDGRCITTIYYCNENWDMQKDGGTLRLYPETSMTPMDIDPRADRLVFFWSDRRNPHEVMPVYRHRFAITIWYMDKNERDRAINKPKENLTNEEEQISKSIVNTPSHHPHKTTSTQDLSSLDMTIFASTSSDPTLGNLIQDDQASETGSKFSTISNIQHPESSDSGISLSNSDLFHNLKRNNSLQSVSDAYKSERTNERRSSTSSDGDIDESNFQVAKSENPEYII